MNATTTETGTWVLYAHFLNRAYEQTVLKVDIKRNGQSILGVTNDVIVGEKIALECVVEPSGLSASNIEWTIDSSSEVIANWTVEDSGQGALVGTIFPLTNLTASTVNYYWIDGAFGGNIRHVTCSADINGVTCQGTTTFRVFRPTATLTVANDQVYLNHTNYYSGEWLHYGFGQNGPPYGVAADRTINVPSGFSSYVGVGYYDGAMWVQLGSVNRSWKEESTSNCYEITCVDFLDREYPFAGGTEDFNDSPAQPLDDTAWVEVDNESYKTWLMWRPSGGDSIPVPLKRMSWSWSGEAHKNGQGQWVLDSSASPSPSVVDTTTHPEWEFTYPYDASEGQITCP